MVEIAGFTAARQIDIGISVHPSRIPDFRPAKTMSPLSYNAAPRGSLFGLPAQLETQVTVTVTIPRREAILDVMKALAGLPVFETANTDNHSRPQGRLRQRKHASRGDKRVIAIPVYRSQRFCLYVVELHPGVKAVVTAIVRE